jgi:DNA invertase Pin-like site-specific DNA recombinase
VSDRKKREQLMRAARRKEIDAIVVWKLDRWGRSLHDLVSTLKELSELEVGALR